MARKLIVAVAVLFASAAATANYVGSEVQYFNPTPENMDFFTVHSSRTLPKGTFKTTLFFDYAKNIHYSSPSLENNVLQGQLGFGMGLTDKMSFSLAGSGILNYSTDTGAAYSSEDFTHVRAGVKYKFCNCSQGGFALAASVGYGLMDPDYLVGDDNDFGASVTLIYDKVLTDRVRFGANLGYRYRNSGDAVLTTPASYTAITAGNVRDGSDILASVGLNFVLNEKLTGVTELYASLPTDQFFDFTTDAGSYDQKGAEVLLGANYALSEKMDLGFGATVGVFDAQNADWRAFVGMGYFFGGAAEDAAFNLAGKGSAPVAAAPVKTEAPVSIEDAPTLKEFNITARFPSGSADLTAEAKTQLSAAGEFLKANPEYRMVFVEGHTDSQGAEEFNKQLSERRAQMVKVYLARAYEIPADKIKSVGFGETAPVADNSTAAGRAKNRRVVIKVK